MVYKTLFSPADWKIYENFLWPQCMSHHTCLSQKPPLDTENGCVNHALDDENDGSDYGPDDWPSCIVLDRKKALEYTQHLVWCFEYHTQQDCRHVLANECYLLEVCISSDFSTQNRIRKPTSFFCVLSCAENALCYNPATFPSEQSFRDDMCYYFDSVDIAFAKNTETISYLLKTYRNVWPMETFVIWKN